MPTNTHPKKRVVLKRDRIDYGDGLTNLRTIPMYDIFLGKKKIGNITAGHAIIRADYRRKGHFFFGALPKYERMHERMFRKGLFKKYKSELIEAIGGHVNMKAFVKHIQEVKAPTHFQFWRDPKTARKFMIYGNYTLAKPSIRELERKGLPKGVTQEQIAEFLKTFKRPKYPNDVLLLLEKPAK